MSGLHIIQGGQERVHLPAAEGAPQSMDEAFANLSLVDALALSVATLMVLTQANPQMGAAINVIASDLRSKIEGALSGD